MGADIDVIKSYVRSIDLFKENNIQGKDLNDLCEFCEYIKLEEKDAVFRVGQEIDRMFILVDGEVDFKIHMMKQRLTLDAISNMAENLGCSDMLNIL